MIDRITEQPFCQIAVIASAFSELLTYKNNKNEHRR